MDGTAAVLFSAHEIYARASNSTSDPTTATRPPAYKAVGISLAVASGLFIGVSFVLKKLGLLKANVKYNEEAGEGYGYLKNAYWWSGMTLMILGEICNFVAYAFVDAILVTPLGALSVVITTILSAIFLKERLSFVGKIGCFQCIIGSVVILLNAPQQSSAATIQEMQHYVITPGFLTYAGVIIVGCIFVALWAGPRYGKKSMLVYLTVCSLIGGLSVVATQGLGAAIVAQAGGTPQFNQWFLYVLFVFVVATLLTEIIYLNKALNLFNAALVTPTYYVYFTSSTIVASAILFQGFKGTAASITTVVLGFLVICSGVVLLQLSKSAKDVPDAAVFSGDLDQVRTVAEQEQPESEPKPDAIRGVAGIIRSISVSRRKMEEEEAKRVHEDRLRDLDSIGEDEVYEWDGLRRRKTSSTRPGSGLSRKKTIHPPLGMSRLPHDDESQHDGMEEEGGHEFFNNVAKRARSVLHIQRKPVGGGVDSPGSGSVIPVPLTEVSLPSYKGEEDFSAQEHVYGLPAGLRPQGYGERHLNWAPDVHDPPPSRGSTLAPTPPPHAAKPDSAKRQFSFQAAFQRAKSPDNGGLRPGSRSGPNSRPGSRGHHQFPRNVKATEEERLGLVKGDSNAERRLNREPSPDTRSESSGESMSDVSRDEWRKSPSASYLGSASAAVLPAYLSGVSGVSGTSSTQPSPRLGTQESPHLGVHDSPRLGGQSRLQPQQAPVLPQVTRATSDDEEYFNVQHPPRPGGSGDGAFI